MGLSVIGFVNLPYPPSSVSVSACIWRGNYFGFCYVIEVFLGPRVTHCFTFWVLITCEQMETKSPPENASATDVWGQLTQIYDACGMRKNFSQTVRLCACVFVYDCILADLILDIPYPSCRSAVLSVTRSALASVNTFALVMCVYSFHFILRRNR